MADYLDMELRLNMLLLQTMNAEPEDLPAGAERSANVKARREIRTWMLAQYDVPDAMFSPFLRLTR